jgi:hypothetical protein
MIRSRDVDPDIRRTALQRRVDRLKVAAWAVVAGAWLGLWALVSGAVAGTATAPSVPTASGEQSQATDLFGSGSTLGVGEGTPIVRSHGS